ncbi:MAG: hypothetical protein HFI75_03705 [Lachnospiraceae bacterium]|nr:hypothetical protein [Lachnospiraceae bacterium]
MAAKKEKAGKVSKQTESEYSVQEFAEGAETIFQVKKECVIAALKAADITSCTISQAKDVVQKFMKKEVK